MFSSAPCTIKETKRESSLESQRQGDSTGKCGHNRKDALRQSSLVVDAYEVVGELLNSVCGRTWLDVLGVVGDEKSLLGLDDDDTLLALIGCQLAGYVKVELHAKPHLLAVQASVVSLEDDELLASNVETSALDLLDVGGVLECRDDLGHFLRRNLQNHAISPCSFFDKSHPRSSETQLFLGSCSAVEWWRTHSEASGSGPDAVAFAVEDGGLVNVASANQAGGSDVSDVSVGGGDGGVYLWSTYAVGLKVSRQARHDDAVRAERAYLATTLLRMWRCVEKGVGRVGSALRVGRGDFADGIIEWFESSMALSPGIDC